MTLSIKKKKRVIGEKRLIYTFIIMLIKMDFFQDNKVGFFPILFLCSSKICPFYLALELKSFTYLYWVIYRMSKDEFIYS